MRWGRTTPRKIRTEATTIGEWVRQSRKRHGQSQAELAEAIGVAQRSVSRWETHEVRIGRVQLKRLLDHFGVPESQYGAILSLPYGGHA